MTGRPLVVARWLGVLAALLGAVVAVPASAALTITPITWNVIGLDHNKPADPGPDSYPVGARVCNVSATPTGPITATFVRDGATNPYITVESSTVVTIRSLAAGGAPPSPFTITTPPANCYDFYYQIRIQRTAAAHDTAQGYHIEATDGATTVSTPIGRELFVERLISQGRNAVTGFSGPSTVYVGEESTYSVTGYTATGGYEQVEFAPVLPFLFRLIRSSVTSMAVPGGAVNSSPYADACGWENDPTSPDYWRASPSDECHNPDNYAGGKAGGNPVSMTYRVKALQAGTGQMTNIWYDFSGSSFHYNSDVGSGVNNINVSVVQPAAPTVTKSFSPASVPVGGEAVLAITLTNNNPALPGGVAAPPIRGVSFTDTYPAGMVNTATPNVSTTCTSSFPDPVTVVSATAGGNSLSLSDGTVPPQSSCTVTVNVRIDASTGTTISNGSAAYVNSTGPVSTTSAGTVPATSGTLGAVGAYKSVRLADDLDGSGGPSVGDTLEWSLYFHNPAGAAAIADFQVNDPLSANQLLASGPAVTFIPGGCAAGSANASYDGAGDTALFDAPFSLAPGCTVRVDLGLTPAAGAAGTTVSNQATATGAGLAATPTDNIDNSTVGLPTDVAVPAGSIAQGQAAATADPTTVDIPVPPTVAKAFMPPSIPVGATSRLTLTLGNAGASAVTLVTDFTDVLPAGLLVATPNGLGGSCAPGSVTAPAGGLAITYATGASIPSGGCTISVDVRNAADTDGSVANAAGLHSNVVPAGALRTNSGANTTAATAELAVVGGYKSVVLDTDQDASGGVTPGDTLTWSVYFHNPAGGAPIAGFQATDNVGAGMAVTAAPAVSFSPGGCASATGNGGFDGGAVTELFSSAFTLNGDCTVRVDYETSIDMGTAGATLSNQASGTGTGLATVLTDNVDGTTTGLPAGVAPVGQSLAQTQASPGLDPTRLVVPLPPTLAKSFSPDPVGIDQPSTLTITLTNPNSGTALSNATFSDVFPTAPGQMVVATPPAAATSCGGTLQNSSGGPLVADDVGIRLLNGTIPAGGSCTVTVNVTAPAGGSYVNTIAAGALSTSGGTNQNPASDTLAVVGAPTVMKMSAVVSDPTGGSNPKRIPGAVIQYSIIVTNTSATQPITGVVVSDGIPGNTSYVLESITVAGVYEDDDLTDDAGDEADPNGADYNLTTAGTVTAVIASIPASGSVTVSFHVTVD